MLVRSRRRPGRSPGVAQLLTATENGYGKRTHISEYTRHGRGTKGMIAIQQSERNGKVGGGHPGGAPKTKSC